MHPDDAEIERLEEALKSRTDELYRAYNALAAEKELRLNQVVAEHEEVVRLRKSLEYERQNADEWNESANDSEADSEKWKKVALAIYEHIEDTNEGQCPVIREYALVLGKTPVGEDDLAMDELMEGLKDQDHLEAHPWNIQEDR